MSTGTGRVAPLTDEDLASLGAWLSEPQSGAGEVPTADPEARPRRRVARIRLRFRLFPKAKHKLQGWCEREFWARASVHFAKQIMLSVAGPGARCEDPYCPDRVRYRQAEADADLVLRLGRQR